MSNRLGRVYIHEIFPILVTRYLVYGYAIKTAAVALPLFCHPNFHHRVAIPAVTTENRVQEGANTERSKNGTYRPLAADYHSTWYEQGTYQATPTTVVPTWYRVYQVPGIPYQVKHKQG